MNVIRNIPRTSRILAPGQCIIVKKMPDATSIPPTTQLFVVPVLKGFHSLHEMQALAEKAKQNPLTAQLHFPFEQVKVLDQHHHGGYAQTSPELDAFISAFNETKQFPIEPTYTGKVLHALNAQLPYLQGKNVLFIHTGGVFFH